MFSAYYVGSSKFVRLQGAVLLLFTRFEVLGRVNGKIPAHCNEKKKTIYIIYKVNERGKKIYKNLPTWGMMLMIFITINITRALSVALSHYLQGHKHGTWFLSHARLWRKYSVYGIQITRKKIQDWIKKAGNDSLDGDATFAYSVNILQFGISKI